ncbi:MAG: hypothetical protein GEV03_00335 [Streptosporangiales bacterium]|nr:hypothetical protein [Streptosporangiales bacterium]
MRHLSTPDGASTHGQARGRPEAVQPPVRRTGGGGQRGSATIWVLTLAAVLWSIAVAVMVVGQARAVRHRAGAAADLAALAAARHALVWGSGACKPAGAVARVNGGTLVACTVRDRTVDVVVEVPFGRLGSIVGERTVRARARAGPTRLSSEPQPGGGK